MFFTQAYPSNFFFKEKKKSGLNAPKFSVKYFHVMADLEIKFKQNRSRWHLAWFGLVTKFSAYKSRYSQDIKKLRSLHVSTSSKEHFLFFAQADSSNMKKKKKETGFDQSISHSDWLTDWVNDWLTDWLIDWLTHQTTDCHSDWLTDWVTDWLTDWLTDWTTDWLTYWLSSS